ncbi:hypothetical protein JCM19046_1078 [Bacillus sp. JCM 19046]|uniref:Uncharacterized protein n=1 Tax=Shouchella xiaoxiensis TaxID=766895 RepID=A0ABS2SXU6_9BACI|nr:hypothetical protein [Shouchella xiaoxiensis]MBM7840353.1 hypothetical protein [Shouchella xiaoxiensis]GAF13621.1 hypothetical protein JCM19045_2877 [Bacillus sp. JCM 19045]GAF16630.1 hypothetical protein JCM19046_1078 [Bacillus sp. JCM 19046]
MSHEHEKHSVCISVPKVFDWVTRQVDLPTLSFREPDLSTLFPGSGSPTPGPGSLCALLQAFPNYQTVCRVIESSLLTNEVTNPFGRTEVEVTLPNGEEVCLEKVKVLAKGLIEVDVLDELGNLIVTSSPIDFATIQTFYLCAPEGTSVDAFISAGQCDAEIVCDATFSQLDISFSFCLDVHVFADVRLEIEAAYCKPRHEFPVSDVICKENKFPPQCPIVFPGKGFGKKSTAGKD